MQYDICAFTALSLIWLLVDGLPTRSRSPLATTGVGGDAFFPSKRGSPVTTEVGVVMRGIKKFQVGFLL